MKIYFVRHGQNQHNKEGRANGQSDLPLTEEGIQQAQELASILPNHFTVIYSSDFIRCKQTVDILNKKFNLPVNYDIRLRERNLGSFDGKKVIDIDPDLLKKDLIQEYDYRPYGGESVEEVKSRVFESVRDIQQKEKDEKVLIVTSAGVIRLLYNILKGEVVKEIKNSSVHEFDFLTN